MLIRLRGCAGWSAPLLFAYGGRQVFAWCGPCNYLYLSLFISVFLTVVLMVASNNFSVMHVSQSVWMWPGVQCSLFLVLPQENIMPQTPNLYFKYCSHIILASMSQCTTKWSVLSAKTQISLGRCPGWPKSSWSIATHWEHSEDWSDWVNAQADQSLRWAHRSFCWFCHATAQIWASSWKQLLSFLTTLVCRHSSSN